jgi:hypothetical protein
MACCVEPIHHGLQRLVFPEGIQMHDQRLRRLIQRPRTVPERPPQCPHMTAQPVPRQPRRKRRRCVVYKCHQPTQHLQRPPLKTGPLRVRTCLVVTARHRIQTLVMHPHAIPLFVVLPQTIHRQNIQRTGQPRREQWMPTVLLRPRHDLPANDRPHRLLRRLVPQHRRRFRQANFLGGSPRIRAWFVQRLELVRRQRLPQLHPVRVTTGTQCHVQLRILLGHIPQRPHPRVRFARSRIEQRMQVGGPTLLERLPQHRHGQVHQFPVARRGPHGQIAIVQDVKGVEQLLATHVLVAGGDVAFGDAELVRPAGNAVFVIADQSQVIAQPLPGTGAAAEGIDRVPGQMASPAADQLTRRTTTAAGQQGEPQVVHLLQMPEPLQADDQSKGAGQEAAWQTAERIGQTGAGNGQPAERLAHQQEGARILRVSEQKGGAGTAASTTAAVGAAEGDAVWGGGGWGT